MRSLKGEYIDKLVSPLNGKFIYYKGFCFGLQEVYFLTCLLTHQANKSTAGVPSISHMKLNTPVFSCHFVSSSDFREFLSASAFYFF